MRIYIQLKRIEVNRVLFQMPNGVIVENCQTCTEKCHYIGNVTERPMSHNSCILIIIGWKSLVIEKLSFLHSLT